VVVHSFLTEYATHPAVAGRACFVEKAGNTDSLKQAVGEMLMRSYPGRFRPGGGRRVAGSEEPGHGEP
jgi:hypothetical protein